MRVKDLAESAVDSIAEPYAKNIQALFSLLKMDLIPPDEVHLKPDLFTKTR